MPFQNHTNHEIFHIPLRYNAWYQNTGRLDMVTSYVESEARDWHVKHGKPVLMSEYGSDTVEGLHMLPAYVWSEEFQVNSS